MISNDELIDSVFLSDKNVKKIIDEINKEIKGSRVKNPFTFGGLTQSNRMKQDVRDILTGVKDIKELTDQISYSGWKPDANIEKITEDINQLRKAYKSLHEEIENTTYARYDSYDVKNNDGNYEKSSVSTDALGDGGVVDYSSLKGVADDVGSEIGRSMGEKLKEELNTWGLNKKITQSVIDGVNETLSQNGVNVGSIVAKNIGAPQPKKGEAEAKEVLSTLFKNVVRRENTPNLVRRNDLNMSEEELKEAVYKGEMFKVKTFKLDGDEYVEEYPNSRLGKAWNSKALQTTDKYDEQREIARQRPDLDYDPVPQGKKPEDFTDDEIEGILNWFKEVSEYDNSVSSYSKDQSRLKSNRALDTGAYYDEMDLYHVYNEESAKGIFDLITHIKENYSRIIEIANEAGVELPTAFEKILEWEDVDLNLGEDQFAPDSKNIDILYSLLYEGGLDAIITQMHKTQWKTGLPETLFDPNVNFKGDLNRYDALEELTGERVLGELKNGRKFKNKVSTYFDHKKVPIDGGKNLFDEVARDAIRLRGMFESSGDTISRITKEIEENGIDEHLLIDIEEFVKNVNKYVGVKGGRVPLNDKDLSELHRMKQKPDELDSAMSDEGFVGAHKDVNDLREGFVELVNVLNDASLEIPEEYKNIADEILRRIIDSEYWGEVTSFEGKPIDEDVLYERYWALAKLAKLLDVELPEHLENLLKNIEESKPTGKWEPMQIMVDAWGEVKRDETSTWENRKEKGDTRLVNDTAPDLDREPFDPNAPITGTDYEMEKELEDIFGDDFEMVSDEVLDLVEKNKRHPNYDGTFDEQFVSNFLAPPIIDDNIDDTEVDEEGESEKIVLDKEAFEKLKELMEALEKIQMDEGMDVEGMMKGMMHNIFVDKIPFLEEIQKSLERIHSTEKLILKLTGDPAKHIKAIADALNKGKIETSATANFEINGLEKLTEPLTEINNTLLFFEKNVIDAIKGININQKFFFDKDNPPIIFRGGQHNTYKIGDDLLENILDEYGLSLKSHKKRSDWKKSDSYVDYTKRVELLDRIIETSSNEELVTLAKGARPTAVSMQRRFDGRKRNEDLVTGLFGYLDTDSLSFEEISEYESIRDNLKRDFEHYASMGSVEAYEREIDKWKELLDSYGELFENIKIPKGLDEAGKREFMKRFLADANRARSEMWAMLIRENDWGDEYLEAKSKYASAKNSSYANNPSKYKDMERWEKKVMAIEMAHEKELKDIENYLQIFDVIYDGIQRNPTKKNLINPIKSVVDKKIKQLKTLKAQTITEDEILLLELKVMAYEALLESDVNPYNTLYGNYRKAILEYRKAVKEKSKETGRRGNHSKEGHWKRKIKEFENNFEELGVDVEISRSIYDGIKRDIEKLDEEILETNDKYLRRNLQDQVDKLEELAKHIEHRLPKVDEDETEVFEGELNEYEKEIANAKGIPKDDLFTRAYQHLREKRITDNNLESLNELFGIKTIDIPYNDVLPADRVSDILANGEKVKEIIKELIEWREKLIKRFEISVKYGNEESIKKAKEALTDVDEVIKTLFPEDKREISVILKLPDSLKYFGEDDAESSWANYANTDVRQINRDLLNPKFSSAGVSGIYFNTDAIEKGFEQLNNRREALVRQFSVAVKMGDLKNKEKILTDLRTIDSQIKAFFPNDKREIHLAVMEDGKLSIKGLYDDIKEGDVTQAEGDMTKFTRRLENATRNAHGLQNALVQLFSIVGTGRVWEDMVSASSLRQTNMIMLSARRGHEEASKLYDKIQALVVELPGNDTFLTNILTMLGTMDKSLTGSDLEYMGGVIADYYMGAQAKGQFNNETERELRNYLMTGQTRNLTNSIIASEIESLKGLNSVKERTIALEKALQKTGMDSIAHYDSYTNTFEEFKGRFQKSFADLGDLFLGALQLAMKLYNFIDRISGSFLSQITIVLGVVAMSLVTGIIIMGQFMGSVGDFVKGWNEAKKFIYSTDDLDKYSNAIRNAIQWLGIKLGFLNANSLAQGANTETIIAGAVATDINTLSVDGNSMAIGIHSVSLNANTEAESVNTLAKIKNFISSFRESAIRFLNADVTAGEAYVTWMETEAEEGNVIASALVTVQKWTEAFAREMNALATALEEGTLILYLKAKFSEFIFTIRQTIQNAIEIAQKVIKIGLHIAEAIAVYGLAGAWVVLDAIITVATGGLNKVLVAIIALIFLVIAGVYQLGQSFGWWEDIGSMIGAVVAGLGRIWEAFVNSDQIQYAMYVLSGFFENLQAWFGSGSIFNGLWEMIFGTPGGAGDWDILGDIINFLGAIGEALWEISNLDEIIEVFRAVGAYMGWVLTQWNKFTETSEFQDLIDGFREIRVALGEVWAEFEPIFKELGQAWAELWDSGDYEPLKEDGNELLELFKSIAHFIRDYVIPFIKLLIPLIKATLTPLMVTLKVITEIIKGAKWVMEHFGMQNDKKPTNIANQEGGYNTKLNQNYVGAYVKGKDLAKTYNNSSNNPTIINNNFGEGSVQTNAHNMTQKEVRQLFTSAFGYNKANGVKGVLR